MIDNIELNRQLANIVDLRNELETLGYSDESYDDVEDELHEEEDLFVEEFGDFLEKVIANVHKEVGTSAEILLPTAYLSKSYEVFKENGEEIIYHIDDEDGIYVKIDDFVELNTRIVFVPNPARFYFTVNGEIKREVWRMES